jgi:hypothetical protein
MKDIQNIIHKAHKKTEEFIRTLELDLRQELCGKRVIPTWLVGRPIMHEDIETITYAGYNHSNKGDIWINTEQSMNVSLTGYRFVD